VRLPAVDHHNGDLAGDRVDLDSADFELERGMLEPADIASHATLPKLWMYRVMDIHTAASRTGDRMPMG
jgi:hypothetical protein